MPKFAVTVNDNGVRKRVVLESDTQPTEADVLSALRGSAQPSGPATIAEMRRREEQGMVSALPPEQVQAAVGSTAQLNQGGHGWPERSVPWNRNRRRRLVWR
jgi:hypothetical protein